VVALGAPSARQEPDIPRVAAQYVRVFVEQLSNVVAQEDLTLRRPRISVRSDLLLVQYPGSKSDFLTFRDVATVNGAPVQNREARLTDLFLTDFENARQRAGQIASASAPYVPPALNPLFAIAFLQAAYQPRFKISWKDAGRDFPKGYKAITYVETARPTLLRSTIGPTNVPTRGTAWLDPQTGRIVQTSLEVRDSRGIITVATKFAVDDRLGVMVPVEMKTENPEGLATYTNFRRFAVETQEQIRK
jgi:hypothetical protein